MQLSFFLALSPKLAWHKSKVKTANNIQQGALLYKYLSFFLVKSFHCSPQSDFFLRVLLQSLGVFLCCAQMRNAGMHSAERVNFKEAGFTLSQ